MTVETGLSLFCLSHREVRTSHYDVLEEYLQGGVFAQQPTGVHDSLASWLTGMCGPDGRGDSLADTSWWSPDS